ncbi:MAG TPA: CerR family C-terminal domain-containing protein [Chthoniobacter sp.]|jgi:AcrR family transcriptional regulator
MLAAADTVAIQDTRRKLLQAAGEIFAERGFHKATIREITDRAGVNVAAVNYHFRDKAELYRAVLNECHCSAQAAGGPISLGDGAPEERLRLYIDGFLHRLLHPDRPKWQGLLMAREMIEPTDALDILVRESIRPRAQELERIITDLTGGKLTKDREWMLSFSVVAQCLFYLHDRPLIERLYPKLATHPPTIEQLVEHIHAFSLAAIRAAQ